MCVFLDGNKFMLTKETFRSSRLVVMTLLERAAAAAAERETEKRDASTRAWAFLNNFFSVEKLSFWRIYSSSTSLIDRKRIKSRFGRSVGSVRSDGRL